jgi:hypothetical protein
MAPSPITDNTLFYGDNLDILREYIPTESVDLMAAKSIAQWQRGCDGGPVRVTGGLYNQVPRDVRSAAYLVPWFSGDCANNLRRHIVPNI